jgi:eukaryotic-like serine/threonine-protein kinase
MTSVAGDVLGHYHLEALIGHGSMADVYRATHVVNGTSAAVKIVHPHLLNDQSCLDRFKREAEALGNLRHPHIVQLYEFVCRPGEAYLAMEYLGGGTLEAYLNAQRQRHETIPLEQALEWLEAIASAVDYAHSCGLIHRDLKPANILFRVTGEPVLTDFGLAYVLGQARLSASGAITGTPAYLSPEQARGSAGDARSEVYSLGVILYELLAGQTPFQGNMASMIIKHISEPPPSPRLLGCYLPAGVERAMMRALSKSPAERYQTALAFVRSLRAAARRDKPARAEKPRQASAKAAVAATPSARPSGQASTGPRASAAAGPARAGARPSVSVAQPPPAARASGLRTVLVLLVVGVVPVAGLWLAIQAGRGHEAAAAPPPRFAIGRQVRVVVPGQASVSVLRGCPTDFWVGVLGVAGDGEEGQVSGRQLCDGDWWYRVSLPGLRDADWDGSGWVDGNYLSAR